MRKRLLVAALAVTTGSSVTCAAETIASPHEATHRPADAEPGGTAIAGFDGGPAPAAVDDRTGQSVTRAP